MIAALLSTAVLAVGQPEVVESPCSKGKVMVDGRCKRHPRGHAGHHRGCLTYRCDRRVTRRYVRQALRRKWRVVRPYNAKLNRMAQCESGGRWHIATGNGFYGGLQFMPSTWRSVGGTGLPHWHSPLEQKFRAVILIRRAGYGPWPVCGAR